MNIEKVIRGFLIAGLLLPFFILPIVGLVISYLDGSLDQSLRESTMGDVEWEEYAQNRPDAK